MLVPITGRSSPDLSSEDLVDLAFRESYASSVSDDDCEDGVADKWFSTTTLGLADMAYRRALKQRSRLESTQGNDFRGRNKAQPRLPRQLRLTNDIGIIRQCPHYQSCLWPGRQFEGVQQSGRATYQVAVTLDHVELAESRIAGTLRISGLSVDHPTLTTVFEGEIIGPKYSFATHHKHWGASAKTDIEHWTRFAAFKPIASHAAVRQKARSRHRLGESAEDTSESRIDSMSIGLSTEPPADYELQLDHIFMRWKEMHAIAPVEDHINPAATADDNGAATNFNRDQRRSVLENFSYQGYYYSVLSMKSHHISGFYFHEASELYQQLSLKPVITGHFPIHEWR